MRARRAEKKRVFKKEMGNNKGDGGNRSIVVEETVE